MAGLYKQWNMFLGKDNGSCNERKNALSIRVNASMRIIFITKEETKYPDVSVIDYLIRFGM